MSRMLNDNTALLNCHSVQDGIIVGNTILEQDK